MGMENVEQEMGMVAEREWQNRNGGRTREWEWWQNGNGRTGMVAEHGNDRLLLQP